MKEPKHCIDCNCVLAPRKRNRRLHRALNIERIIFEKSRNENSEDCWNTLRASKTTTWLETASVKVIKLWEIGQSAGELGSD